MNDIGHYFSSIDGALFFFSQSCSLSLSRARESSIPLRSHSPHLFLQSLLFYWVTKIVDNSSMIFYTICESIDMYVCLFARLNNTNRKSPISPAHIARSGSRFFLARQEIFVYLRRIASGGFFSNFLVLTPFNH